MRFYSSLTEMIYALYRGCREVHQVSKAADQNPTGRRGSTSRCSSTFVVKILRTDNGTWQGRVGNVQSGIMVSFRSCLELIRCIDEMLNGQGQEGEGKTSLKATDTI